MARPKMLIPLLVGAALLAATCSVFAQQQLPLDYDGPGHQDFEAMGNGARVEWTSPLMPEFEKAAENYDVPLPLLLTLGYFGSHFENRGDAPTIEGGYGVMALRDNNRYHANSLGEATTLTNGNKERIRLYPANNINAAAAILSAYADQMKVDRNKGLEAWLQPVIKYAGLDEQYSRMFAMEVFDKLAKGLDYVNSQGEIFKFEPQNIGDISLAKLEPSTAGKLGSMEPLTARPSYRPSSMSYSPMTAQYGPATWYAAASCNYTATYCAKNTVVVHTIEGTAAGALSWFQNCNSEVSAHYVVSEAGQVWQCVDENYKAWHVGCANSYCIGIEHEGYTADASHPQSLYDASGLLTRDICDSWGIPKSHNSCPPGVLGHLDINNCVCGGSHTDPGNGWNWDYYMSVVNGTTYINPPYLFGDGTDGWSAGNSASGILWTGADNWGGSIYFDQTGNDCFIYSPTTNMTGAYAPQVVNVNFYAQNGNTNAHDLQVFWKTNAENSFTADKSSEIASYTAQNSYATVNLHIDNNKWWGQTINQLRLDFDNTNHGNRWIINHIVLQNDFWWHFDNSGDVMGWTAGHSLTTPWQITSDSWPGCLVTDQNGDDAYMFSSSITGSGFPYNYLGGVNDWLHVRVYPQSGNSAIHDMGVYWITSSDGTWNEAKSSHVTFRGQNQWVDVYLPVGANSTWPAGHISQLRLDFDQANHGTRWIVDYIKTDQLGTDSTAPSVPSGLTATAASETVVNLTWNASSDSTGVNGYKIYRNGTQIGTSIGTSYTDSTCTAGGSYSYTVSAYDAVGNTSAQSTAATVTTPGGDTQAPTVPTNLAATAVSGTRINLTWTASTDNVGVTGYKIYRGGTQIGTSTTASYSDTTCQSYTSYTYTVAAYDAAGNTSAQSSSAGATTWDATAPSIPTGLAGTATSTTQVNLSWTASTDNVGVTGYKIYRGGTQIGTSATTSYSDTNCTSGGTYSYQVSAYDARGNESAKCTAVSVSTPDVVAPSAPNGLAATVISQTQINLAWTASTDNVAVTGYKIFRDGSQIGTSTSAGYSDTTCDSYTTYVYTVSAYDAAGNNSTLSSSAQATTQPYTDIVVDNPAASYVGGWFTGTSSDDKYGTDYSYCTTQATEDKTATWTPKIDIAGYYTVYCWYPQGSNRSTRAPFTVVWNGGQQTINVDQTTSGGAWVTLVTNKKFAAGNTGYVTLGNGTGESSLSVMADAIRVVLISSDLTAPAIPTNVAASATSATAVNVTWTASTDDTAVTGYRIFRNGTAIGTSSTTSYSDTGLTQLTAYTYTVTAYDAMGNESDQSSSAAATTWDGTAPSVPTGLAATAATPTRVNLSWSASTDNIGVTGYKIYRGGSYVTTVTTTSWTDTGRSPGTAYSYQVSAIDARSNESAKCTAAGATTPAFAEIILDNGSATLSGAWATASSATDKYGADYLFASTVATETKTAAWTPTIPYPGNYNVYIWYSVGSNRATNAPYTTYWDGGSQATSIDQTANGGQWVLIQSGRHFTVGTAGYVVLGNGTGATGKVVIADAVRFVQVSGD